MKRDRVLLLLFMGIFMLGTVFGAAPAAAGSPVQDNSVVSEMHLLHSSSASGVQTSSVVPFQAVVAGSTARLRSYESIHAGLIETLIAGEEVTVLGQTTGTDGKVWYRVQSGSRYGYIRFDQLEVICGTAQFSNVAVPTDPCLGQTNTRAVNVRLGMSTATARVRLLRRGQTFTIICMVRDYLGVPWYYVRIPSGAIGYIRGEFVSVLSGSVPEFDPYAPEADPSSEDESPAPVSDPEEELIYLRWINTHMDLFNGIGDGYQGYSLYDLDGDGIREVLVNCSSPHFSLWQIYTCVEGEIVDLGQLTANGYYLAGNGAGMLLIQILSDTQTQYYRIMKVGDSLVSMYSLERTANEAWEYTWTYNQKPISVNSLYSLLSDFTDDVLQNMGLYRGSDEVPAASSEEYPGDG